MLGRVRQRPLFLHKLLKPMDNMLPPGGIVRELFFSDLFRVVPGKSRLGDF